MPELIMGVRGVNPDFLSVRSSLFYKYTGIGYRIAKLVSKLAKEASAATNKTGANSPTLHSKMSAELAMHIMHEGAICNLGPLATSHEGIAAYSLLGIFIAQVFSIHP